MYRHFILLIINKLQLVYWITLVNADCIQGVNFDHEVIPKEDKANDGEEVDKDECENSSQQD